MVVRLLEFTLEPVGPDGLFRDPGNWWLFVDWDRELDRQAAEQGTILYGLRATLELARRLGRERDVPFLPSRSSAWSQRRGGSFGTSGLADL